MKAALIGKKHIQFPYPESYMCKRRSPKAFPIATAELTPSETHPDLQNISDCLHWAEDQGLAGVNVTHPFKNEVVAHVDELSPIATKSASVNTIVFRDGRRVGHNTDYHGFLTALQLSLPNHTKTTCLVFGAGGAASAVGLALLDSGVQNLTIIDPQEKPRARSL